jgi:hypothetical protein
LKLGFIKGTIDSNLYFKIDHDKILIVEVFFDDIIVGGNDSFCKNLISWLSKKKDAISLSATEA